MPVSTPASRRLDQLNLPYHTFEHAQSPLSLEEAARQRGQEPGQVIRSIIFRFAEGQFIMVLIAGPGQISWKRIRTTLGVSRLTMASETEVLNSTGFVRGAVTPLGLQTPMRILADESVFKPEEISIGSGVRGVAIIMKSETLKKALGSIEIGTFA
jgi:Cys-tRNA(Pro)/Cys-tRNA(Cys) deacylase